MISKRLEDAINAQINAEMWSAYLYLSMSAYCQERRSKTMHRFSITTSSAVAVVCYSRLSMPFRRSGIRP